MENFKYVLILLSWAVLAVAIFRRFNLPPILGYLFVGMIIGPGGLGFIPSMAEIQIFAEFGVVFLMFMIGLEFSVPRLFTMRRALLGLGGIQVLVCTAIAALAGWYFGLDYKAAFVAGGALALSSTAVVVKQLSEQHELHTIHGRLCLSVLIFQDLAAVIFLIVIPALANPQEAEVISPLVLSLVKGVGVCVGMALFGQWLLRPLFHTVARARSTELFMLATLLVALSTAWITFELELSMALGAFLAGLMLGETEFRHQIEIDIRPFRDVLLGLFFISIGALLKLNERWHACREM